MINLAAQQPFYLPDFYFFYKIYRSDLFLLANHLKFRKQSPMVRAGIGRPEKPQFLTIPVKHKGRPHPTLSTVEIAGSDEWKHRHLKTIEASYRNTPFFDHFFPELTHIYNKEHRFLVNLLEELIFWHVHFLLPNKQIMTSDDIGVRTHSDLQSWLPSIGALRWLVYPEELGYYSTQFPGAEVSIIKGPDTIPFPEKYNPTLPLLVLLFLRGPESIQYFLA